MVSAFLQSASPISITSRLSLEIPNQRVFSRRSAAAPLSAAAITVPNPFKQLPWNVKKEREREVRRSRIERAKLYRQLGIAEDATYEELVQATDRLLLLAGSNLKQKIQIEMTKDQILQHRLKERLNGLMQSTEKEARAMSDYEMDGCVFIIFSICVPLFCITTNRNHFLPIHVESTTMTYPKPSRNGMRRAGPKT
jgi:hypothetical protein